MAIIDVKLSTERCGDEKDCTNIYPYNFKKDYLKLDIYGKSQIVITNYQVNKPNSRVELFFTDHLGKTIDILHDCTINIPKYCSSLIFVLDEFDYNDEILRKGIIRSNKERIATFSFELV